MVSQVLILNGFVAGDLFGMTFRWPQENLNCEPLNLPNPLSICVEEVWSLNPTVVTSVSSKTHLQ